jgi:hypothetical protein
MLHLLILTQFAFAGGDTQAVLEKLTEIHPRCTVLLAEADRIYPKAKIASDNPKDILRLLPTRLYIRGKPSGGFATAEWPRYILVGGPNNTFDESGPEPGDISFPLTMKTAPKQSLSIADLRTIKFSLPLNVHRFFSSMRVRIIARNATEPEFLASVAAAVGGMLTTTKTAYKIDFDPAEYRARAVAGWTTVSKQAERDHDLYFAASAAFNAAAFRETSNAVIKAAFDDPEHEHGSWFEPGTEVYSAAWKKVRMFIQSSDKGSGQTVKDAFENFVDPNRPVIAIIRALGGARAGFENADRSHRYNF